MPHYLIRHLALARARVVRFDRPKSLPLWLATALGDVHIGIWHDAHGQPRTLWLAGGKLYGYEAEFMDVLAGPFATRLAAEMDTQPFRPSGALSLCLAEVAALEAKALDRMVA